MEIYLEGKGLDYIETMVSWRISGSNTYDSIINSDCPMNEHNIAVVTQLAELIELLDSHIGSGIDIVNGFENFNRLVSGIED